MIKLDAPMLPLGARTWGSLKPGDRVKHDGRTWEVVAIGFAKHCDDCDLFGVHMTVMGEHTSGRVIHVHSGAEAPL